MKFTAKDLDHLTKLAKIKLTKKEKETYLKQLSDILSYVEKLSKVDVNNIKCFNQEAGNNLREDIVEPVTSDDQKVITDQFSNRKDNLLKTKSPFRKK